MRRFIRFIFNCLRNLSFLFVILLLVTGILFHVYGEEVTAAVEREGATTYWGETDYGIYDSPDEVGFGGYGKAGEEPTRVPPSEQRYKIPLRRGFAYLKFSDFLYFRPRDGYFVTTGGHAFPTDLTLQKFNRLIADNSNVPLFRTKTALINCQHVLGLRVEYLKKFGSYDYYADLRNGDSLKLSKAKYKELIGVMDRQVFVLEPDF
jgi:hypothetical protein